MIIKLPLNRLQDKQAEMTSIAGRMESINDARVAKLVEIQADQDHTTGWKATQVARYNNSPELDNLNSQMRLLIGVMDEQKVLWRDSAALLRDVAVPRRDAMGVDTYTTSLAELGFLMNEAKALALDPDVLQRALDKAVATEDWRALYALTLGRIDNLGRALPSATGLTGTPLSVLPLPGRDESDAIFHQCDIQAIRARGVMLNLSSGDLDPTANSSPVHLARETALRVAERNYQDELKQRDRLRAAPSALERWELLKDGVPAQPTFEDQVKAARARAQATALA